MRLRTRRAAAALAGLLTMLPAATGVAEAAGGPLAPAERRGRQLYLRGIGAEGRELTALLGDGATEVSAGIVPCVQCHGWDGRGETEPGAPPSDITWAALTAPDGRTFPDGRGRPAHSEVTAARAITLGIDPAGHRLASVMPRYRLSRTETNDLIAYLKRLGDDRDPGVTETSITVGTLLPAAGPLAETGRAIGAVLAAYFAEINDRGGIYGRRIRLAMAEPAETAPTARGSLERLLGKEQVFAIVGPWIAGGERDLTALMDKEEVPTIGPFTLFPQVGSPLNRHVFYVFSGLRDQGRALVVFAGQTPRTQTPHFAVISPENEILADVIQAIEDEGKHSGWGAAKRLVYPAGQFDAVPLVRKLSPAGIDAVVFLGAEADAKALMKEAEKRRWIPQILLPGSLVGKQILDVPVSFKDKVVLGFPTIPADQTQAGDREYRALADRYKLPPRHVAVQLSAFAAAKILVEGLKRAGRDVSREKLIRTLEGLYEFNTDVTPPITYGPNRRIGALGAHVAGIDVQKKGFVALREWIPLE